MKCSSDGITVEKFFCEAKELAPSVFRKFGYKSNCYDTDDLVQDYMIYVVKKDLTRRYDAGKGRNLSGYVFQSMGWVLRKRAVAENRRINPVSLDEPLDSCEDESKTLHDVVGDDYDSLNRILDNEISLLHSAICNEFMDYVRAQGETILCRKDGTQVSLERVFIWIKSGLGWAEIGKRLGITRYSVQWRVRRAVIEFRASLNDYTNLREQAYA